MNGIAFSNAVWAMSIGCIFNLIMVAFFTPHIMKLKDKIAGGDEGWLKVMTAAAFFGAVGYMVAQPVVKRGAPLVALIGGFVSMVLVGISHYGRKTELAQGVGAVAGDHRRDGGCGTWPTSGLR